MIHRVKKIVVKSLFKLLCFNDIIKLYMFPSIFILDELLQAKIKIPQNNFHYFLCQCNRVRQGRGPEYLLCSNRFSSNKEALKELVKALYIHTCIRSLKDFFFFHLVCVSSSVIYNLASWCKPVLRRFNMTEELAWLFLKHAVWFMVLTYYLGFRTQVQFLAETDFLPLIFYEALDFLFLNLVVK